MFHDTFDSVGRYYFIVRRNIEVVVSAIGIDAFDQVNNFIFIAETNSILDFFLLRSFNSIWKFKRNVVCFLQRGKTKII